jgi:RimJ/RimL family protein N-acetyltransferase
MATKPILALNRCVVRPYNKDDATSIAEAANNPKIAKWMSNLFPHPYTIEDANKWLSILSPLHDFTICEPNSGSVIGGIGLKPREDIHYRTMEIGYWLSEGYWGCGIVTDVVSAFSEWSFKNFTHVVRLQAEVFEGNKASCRVLEKAGFEFEGRQKSAVEKWGDIMDTMTYVKLRLEK